MKERTVKLNAICEACVEALALLKHWLSTVEPILKRELVTGDVKTPFMLATVELGMVGGKHSFK